MSLTSVYERMVRKNGHPITLTRFIPFVSNNTLTVGTNTIDLRGYAHADHDVVAFGNLDPLMINFATVWEFIVASNDKEITKRIGHIC